MDEPNGHSSRRWSPARAGPLLLVIAGLVAFGVGSVSDPSAKGDAVEPLPHHVGLAAPTARASAVPARRGEPITADHLRGLRLPASVPQWVSVPEIGVSTPLVGLGLAADGTLEPPGNPEDVGWFTGSVTPGAVGPAVLAGHVTWNGSPAVFQDLADLEVADRVLVRRQDGRTAVFAVTAVERFAKSAFPTRSVYGPQDHAALRLITCGGQFDTGSRRYADNLVVFARLIGVRDGADPS